MGRDEALLDHEFHLRIVARGEGEPDTRGDITHQRR